MAGFFLPDYFKASIFEIDQPFLDAAGIQLLLLDIDNTLALHGGPMTDKAMNWMAARMKEGYKLCLLSNNSKKRVEEFNHKLGVCAVSRAAKPFAFHVKRVIKQFGVLPSQTLMVGDQLFTDVLCGKLGKIKTLLVKPMGTEETRFIKLKRRLENKLMKR